MATIIVSATSLRISGGLTVLKQFISNIPDKGDKYIIYVDPNFKEIPKANVLYRKKSTRTQKDRLFFDFWGFRKDVKRSGISPDLIISLQNNALNFSTKIPQLVYYHIPLPLFPNKWNPFKKGERGMYLYKKLYPIIIRILDREDIIYTAQIPSIKNGMSEVLGINKNRIQIFTPDTPPIRKLSSQFEESNVFLYPATPLIYKNHEVLIKATDIIIKRHPELKPSIKLIFTVNAKSAPTIKKRIEKLSLSGNVVMEGAVPFENLLELYSKARALLFPSYIETFGLPLLEAAAYGLPIVASDVPFAHDVIGEYCGATFINPFSPEEWADNMEKYINKNVRYDCFSYQNKNGWPEFFNLIDHLKSN